MDVSMAHSTEGPVEVDRNAEPNGSDVHLVTELEASVLQEEPCSESVKKVPKVLKPNATGSVKGIDTGGASRRKVETKSGTDSSLNQSRSTLARPTLSSTSRTSGSAPVTRRVSTGGLPEKQPMVITKRQSTDNGLAGGKRSSSIASDPLRKSLPELRRSTVSSIGTKTAIRQSVSETRKSVPISPAAKTPRTPASSESSKQDSSIKNSMRLSQSSVSSIKKVSSPSFDSSGSSSTVRTSVAKVSPQSARSPTISSGSKSGTLSRSTDRSSSLLGRRKVGTPESRDSRLIMLPHVEVKAGDDVRLDLRGHKIWSLNSGGLNLSPNLEFVYLRDNLLSTLDGVEVLKRVKVFDLSFNDFKGPGFEPLENCKALQQLYLAGNQITSLKSLPELPNLEFLSVAQNKLKSLSMASQPRLQVLAASKNKISTLKGFPHLPALEHLRVEENPILKMSHLEAAAILLVGPTLKKFNDRDLSREEIAIAKRYPSHTALCIRAGWELCRSDQAVDSTFKFLIEQWKDQLPSGYLLKKAFVDQPFEEDACCCHFEFVRDTNEHSGSILDLKYQWFIGGRTPSNFIAIPGACGEIYFPKHDDIGRILKVECTPTLGDTDYPTIFAISSPVSKGTGIPKVIKIDVSGELVEGNTINGYAEVAWCGGTPGKGVASWLRRRWNSSPVVIMGAEEEEYQLTLDDVDSCLVYMYTPVTEEGAKGEPQYAITDYVKAAPPSVSNVQISGDAVEGCIIRGLGKYFGGKEGPSKFEWLREDKDSGERTLVVMGTNEYSLTKEDIGRRLAFVYIPVNFEGQEGKPMSVVSQLVKQAPPKVTNLKIIGELKEGSKVSVTGIVTGGTEASSRVQWFKTSSSVFEGENGVEALSTSKIAKAFRIPLGAVGKYIIAKFTPMTPDGEAGEPAYVISETAIETLPPSFNFLAITGDYSEGGILTASYGYIGGHEGKSIYNWYLHEVENDLGTPISEVSGLLQYRVPKDAIGKFISFTCTPARDDGIVGEPKTCTGQERVRPGEIFEEEKVEEEEVEVEEEEVEVEVEVEKVEVEEEVEVDEVKEESVEKVHKWLFKEEEDMTWETYSYCCNWNTIERSILIETIHNFAKANCPKDYWKVRTWMNLGDTYNEMAVRENQIKRSYHEIIGGGKYLQSLFTIERQRHFRENTPVDQILLDIFEPCNECRNRIPVFPKSLLNNGSNPSTSFGSRTDSSSHSKKRWTPDELELLKSTISDFSSASVPKPYWDVQLWTDLSETYNVQARFKNLNTVSYLEFISGGMQLQSIFCEERLRNALRGFGSCGRDFVLMKIFEPCLECRKRIPVFPNGLPNNGSTTSASSYARSVQSHFTSYEDESYSATLNNMLIVVREMFEKGLLTSAQLLLVTLKLHDFAQTETWKVCLLNNIFTLEMKREMLIQSISPEA